MSFTVKSIFPALDLPDEEIRLHRVIVGRYIKDSHIARFGSHAPKIEEDGFQVFSYPDEFRGRAEQIAKRYVAKKKLPIKERRQRRRIVSSYQKV